MSLAVGEYNARALSIFGVVVEFRAPWQLKARIAPEGRNAYILSVRDIERVKFVRSENGTLICDYASGPFTVIKIDGKTLVFAEGGKEIETGSLVELHQRDRGELLVVKITSPTNRTDLDQKR